jgi:hypothetical protein
MPEKAAFFYSDLLQLLICREKSELAKAVIAYAEQLGLLVPGANAEIVDLDG